MARYQQIIHFQERQDLRMGSDAHSMRLCVRMLLGAVLALNSDQERMSAPSPALDMLRSASPLI